MKLSIIIPARNEAAMLPETLRAVTSARAGSESELLVVDNASTDGTGEIAEAAGAVVVREEMQTAAAARNAGAAAASGEWLLFLDADTAPTAELFAATLQVMAGNRFDAGSCLIEVGDGNFGKRLWNSIALRRRTLCGAYLFIRATTFLLAGGFDPEMAYGEERKLAEKIPVVRRVVLNQSLRLRSREDALDKF